MNDKTLLPCPFCGGAPKSGDSSYGYWRVYCPDDNHCGVSPFGDGSTEAETIAAWNTRAPTALQSRIEALEAALRDSMTAIDDWLHVYAYDMCDEADVRNSHKRIANAGGTLSYIASVQQQNRDALESQP